jgi:hypothetical protein
VQTPLVASARDGNLWIYDALEFELVKLDIQGRILLRSPKLNQNVRGEIEPMQLIDTGSEVIMRLKDGRMVQFDAFGGFTHKTEQVLSDSYTLQGSKQFYTLGNTYHVLESLGFDGQKHSEFALPSGLQLLSAGIGWVQEKDQWLIVRLVRKS